MSSVTESAVTAFDESYRGAAYAAKVAVEQFNNVINAIDVGIANPVSGQSYNMKFLAAERNTLRAKVDKFLESKAGATATTLASLRLGFLNKLIYAFERYSPAEATTIAKKMQGYTREAAKLCWKVDKASTLMVGAPCVIKEVKADITGKFRKPVLGYSGTQLLIGAGVIVATGVVLNFILNRP